MRGLCFGKPPEQWDTGDDGNRLALALCRVCPLRQGDDCAAGEPDRRPFGVIRAGVAYNERGGRCEICACGYPIDELPDARRDIRECRRCRAPRLRSWDRTFYDRRQYFAKQWKKRKARVKAG
mgnify:CR=1 FL=1